MTNNNSSATQDIWASLESFSTHPEAVALFIQMGTIARLLGLIVGVKGFAAQYQNRLAAISLLSKLLWNPVMGPEASLMLRRYT